MRLACVHRMGPGCTLRARRLESREVRIPFHDKVATCTSCGRTAGPCMTWARAFAKAKLGEWEDGE